MFGYLRCEGSNQFTNVQFRSENHKIALMKRVFVDIASPWCTDTYETCPVIDNQYIPISFIAPILKTKAPILMEKWADNIVKQVEGGGTYRNFVKIDSLPVLLSKEGWDDVKIEKGLKCFEEKAPAPIRKRDISGEEDDHEPYLKKGMTKRKELEETIPKWAKDFMDECRKTVGDQAVDRFIQSEDYEVRCKEAVSAKMAELERDLRNTLLPVVMKELKDEYQIQARHEYEREQRERAMEPFKLKFNRELNDTLKTYAFSTRQNTTP